MKYGKSLVVLSLVAAFGVALPVMAAEKSKAPAKSVVVAKATDKPNAAKKTPKALPKLLDLGSTKCVPCKMMTPILDQLSKDYKGKLKVEFIDVWEKRDEAKKYKVQSIPTQVFFDAKGKEVDRHIGFISKEDILATFKKHGIKF